jgi:RNA polymerase sigma-70 factor (ECF subfamily)
MSGGYAALSREVTQAEAFDSLFDAYHDDVYGLACALLGNAQDAEDVTQDVFLRAYRALPSYQPERAALRTWLARIVVNACKTHRRRNFLRNLWQRAADVDGHSNGDGNGDGGRGGGGVRPGDGGRGNRGQATILAVADQSPWGAPEEHALQAEVRQSVRDVLAKLRIEHRVVVVLHYYEQLSCQEIARILECPDGTVRSRLHYARRMVKIHLEQQALRDIAEDEL